jgi:hypothetical protein
MVESFNSVHASAGKRVTYHVSGIVITTQIQNQLISRRGWQDSLSSTGGPPYPDKYWTKEFVRNDYARITGKTDGFPFYDQYTGYAVEHPNVDYGFPEWQFYLNKALANISTSSGVLSLPNFIWELRELPQMIKDAGLVLLGRPSGLRPDKVHLTETFGWSPLISDLRTLANFGQEVENELRRIYKASQSHSISGRITTQHFGQQSVVQTSRMNYYQFSDMRRDVWFSAKLNPSYSLPRFEDSGDRVAWALGFHNAKKALWDALPWSFMIDYFAGIGDLIEAADAVDDVSSICIMCKDYYNDRVTLVPGSGWENVLTHDGSRKTERKMRRVYTNPRAVPSLALTTLASKLPILGSLVSANVFR